MVSPGAQVFKYAALLLLLTAAPALVQAQSQREVRTALAEGLGTGEHVLLSGSGSSFFAVVGDASRAAELAARWNRALPGRALAVRTVG